LAVGVEGDPADVGNDNVGGRREDVDGLIPRRRAAASACQEGGMDGVEIVVAADGGTVGAAPGDVAGEVAVVGVGVMSVDAGLELRNQAGHDRSGLVAREAISPERRALAR